QPGIGGVDLVHAELLDLAQLGGPDAGGGLEGGSAVRRGAAEREHVGTDGPVLCGEHRRPFTGVSRAIDPIGTWEWRGSARGRGPVDPHGPTGGDAARLVPFQACPPSPTAPPTP